MSDADTAAATESASRPLTFDDVLRKLPEDELKIVLAEWFLWNTIREPERGRIESLERNVGVLFLLLIIACMAIVFILTLPKH